jgi:hypothetical protein
VNNRQRWVITGVRTDDMVGLDLEIAVANISVDRVVVGDSSVGTSPFLRGLAAEFRGGDRK